MATKVAIEVDIKTGGASDEIISLREELEKVKATQAELTDQMKTGFDAAEKGAKGASKGMKSFGTSIGGVIKSLGIIGVAMAVFAFMKDILMKNQKLMDALSTATIALEIVIMKLFEALEPVGKAMADAFENPKQSIDDLWEAIKVNLLNRLDGFVNSWVAVGDVIKGVFELDWDAVVKGAEDYGTALVQMSTGLDAEQQKAFIEGVKDFAVEVANATVKAVAQADALTRLRNEVALLEASQQKIQLGFQREAELQRQARDDIRLTIAERIAANDKLGEILKEQAKTEEERVNKTLLLRQLELKQLGENTERLAAVAVAEGAVAELRERIVSQESEQLTNQAALQKELFDLKLELAKVGKEQRELELLELQQHYALLEEQARLAGDKTTDIEGAKREALAKLSKKFRDEDLANEKKLRDDKVKLQQSYLSATGGILGAIDQLVAASGNNSKQALVLQKTLAVAQIAIDTAKAIVGAIAQAQSVPYPGNLVAIATGVAAVIAGIASAVTTLNSADVGGATAAQPQAPQVTSAPAVQQATSGTTELGGAEQAQLAPIQAFVVETEVTGNQNNVNQIESQANFG
jgi:hypothetical protein